MSDIEPISSPLAPSATEPFLQHVRPYLVPLALALTLLLGAAFRFTGLNWDDYQHLHPDERFLTMVETGIALPGTPDIGGALPPGCRAWGGYFDTNCSPLNPYNRGFGNFVYGTFPLFLVKAAGELLGQSGYDEIFLVGRALSGLFDLSTVLLLFFIGRRLFDSRVGLLAALFASASVLNIQQSHFFTVDTFANVPLLIAFWFTLNIMDGRGRWLSFVMAGLFFGLSLAARINLAPFAGIIALAGMYRWIQTLHISPASAPLLMTRQFESTTDSIPGVEGQVPPARSREVRWGPLTIEVEAQRAARAAIGARDNQPAVPWWEQGAIVGLQLAIAAVTALIAFRIAQPYAFQGLGLNPQFAADMNYARDLIGGQIDVPPMHQWTARPDYWFPFVNMVLWGMGPGLGLAGTMGFLLGGWQLVRSRDWRHLLNVFWVGGLFFYLGQQVAKTDRYYLPLYPFVALFAAYFLIWLWDAAGRQLQARLVHHDDNAELHANSVFRRPFSYPPPPELSPAPALTRQGSRINWWQVATGVVALTTLGITVFWAAAFTSIYTRPVSRVTASRWIYQHVPRGAALGNEHWDDPIPLRVDGQDGFGGIYRGVELQWYGEDTPEKRQQAIEWLDQVQYINLTSNRLYLSIPRLPLRYPMTTKYYEALFNGSLGFKLVETFTSRPQFVGIEINDDDAEESFTVYDHPKVLIFEKTASYSHENTAALFNSVDLDTIIRQKPLDATLSHNAFQLDAPDLAADRSGGTWSQIFDPTDLVNRLPVISWLVLLELLGLTLFPVAFAAFRRFADRGYAFARALAVLFLGWGAWTLGSYHILPFSRESILIVWLALAAVGVILAWRQRVELAAFAHDNLPLLLTEELVFFAFFFLSLWIRFGNPDLWHPSFGGEKPMDFVYLNAIIKTTWFPPYNPWFEGGYINYYYFGQVLSATLVRLTGIIPEVAYNLLLPMFFAFTALGAFGVVFNLVRAAASRLTRLHDPVSESPTEAGERVYPLLPILAGIGAAILVLVIGNLGEIGVLGTALSKLGGSPDGNPAAILSGLSEWLIGRKPFTIGWGDWYWTATRTIPDTINEFPFFTFLYADLHAHLMSLAFTLVALGFALHAVLLRGRLRWYDLGAAALVLGALRPLNTWDYPTYLALVGAALVIGLNSEHGASGEPRPEGATLLGYLQFGILAFLQVLLVVIPINALGVKITLDVVIYGLVLGSGLVLGWFLRGSKLDPVELVSVVGSRLIALVGLSSLLYYPFLAFYGAAYTSVELWKGSRTGLQQFLTVHGIFLFIVATWLVIANIGHLSRRTNDGARSREMFDDLWIYVAAGVIAASVILIAVDLLPFAIVLPLAALALRLLLRRDSAPVLRLLALFALAALMLTAMVEVIVIKGDIGRMNTVFKFYLQAWILFSVVSAAGLALSLSQLLPRRRAVAVGFLPETPVAAAGQTTESEPTASSPVQSWSSFKLSWWGALAVLVLGGMLYPLFATYAKVNDRYVAGAPSGLDGLAYMKDATYGENGHDIPLGPDREAIQWLRENVQGSPVIVEANTGLYRWGNRVSINTGLPTVIGWDWHTKQQYALLDGAIIDRRLDDLRNFYNTADPNEAIKFIKRYDASLIYVGPLEHAVYEPAGLGKFAAMVSAQALIPVYDSGQVQIYQVNPMLLAAN